VDVVDDHYGRLVEIRGELHGLVVVDMSQGVAGAYCAKMFTDGGATVTRVEPIDGDPQRRQQWSGEPTAGDAPLWQYLRHGQRSVTAPADAIADPASDERLQEMCASADLVISSAPIAAAWPGTVVLIVTPYGTTGPDAGRPATEFTVQADSGAVLVRGIRELPPFQMGGRVVEWVAGAYGAVGSLAAIQRSRATGQGEVIDLSLCEVAQLTGTAFMDLYTSLQGRPDIDATKPGRSMEIPSIEPSLDGYVGFNTNTREQWESFAIMIERPDLLETAEFASLVTRIQRADEWNALVHAWTTQHTTDEIVELAAALRIPVAPVADGRMLVDMDHPRERGVYVTAPSGEFRMPRRPYLIDGERDLPPLPAPAPGSHDDAPLPSRHHRPVVESSERPALPLAGLKVIDMTAWWAGPSATGILAALGADVIHVESARRLDGIRLAGGAFFGNPGWWEYSAFFLQVNTNKSDITLDLETAEGRELLLRLVAESDIVVENYTPRVLDNFALGWDVIHATNPRAILVRMPAFGLDGPWRDRPGFAQTMEQITGLAWLTGHPEDQPRIQRGPCDPNGGMHAAFAALSALERRKRTGLGCMIEAVMFEAAINVAAEPVIEWTAHGTLVERDGNRSPYAAPQNLYLCNSPESWLALSCATDEQWRSLAVLLGRGDLIDDPRFATLADRRRHHDELDEIINAWASAQDRDTAVAALNTAGVPAAIGRDHRRTFDHPQFVARGFCEEIDHPVVGTHAVPGLPFRYASVDRWITRPAPILGQDNEAILGGRLGLSADELEHLSTTGIIGTAPRS
jgi:crotonobetainyl-CoA:carnitine CoA-transferase CaiB-like acyl-CoA transferase